MAIDFYTITLCNTGPLFFYCLCIAGWWVCSLNGAAYVFYFHFVSKNISLVSMSHDASVPMVNSMSL